MRKRLKGLTALQTLAIGFAVMILLGALLLSLPAASRGLPLAFGDALFTATSATCVTGLAVCDTYTQFAFFGQLVILCLIQIGGLGFMTVAVLFSLVLRKRIGLKERSYLMEAVSSPQLGGVVRFVRRILLGTAVIELTGAALLGIRFVPMFGWREGAWFALFHSISAFCNAGFDLMGGFGPYSSLEPFASDVLVNLTIMGLIVTGGIGFLVWDDIAEHKWHVRRYLLHTKIMLCATVALLALSFAVYLALEGEGAMAGMTGGEKALASAFLAVTPRTAGFNTVPMDSLSEAGAAFTSILMLIGAGAGSTGGGVKLTTVVVILLSALFYARGQEDVNVFHRRVADERVRRAFCGAAMYLLLAIIGCFMILAEQRGMALTDALFEALSAIGTVGLSRAGTASLGGLSRATLIVLMYAGRVGSLSVAMALSEKKRPAGLRNTVGKVVVG